MLLQCFSGSCHKELDDFINQENTWFIRDLLSNNDNQISRIRDTLASGFTKNEFNERFFDLAEDGWIPKLKSQFSNFKSAKERQDFFQTMLYSLVC